MPSTAAVNLQFSFFLDLKMPPNYVRHVADSKPSRCDASTHPASTAAPHLNLNIFKPTPMKFAGQLNSIINYYFSRPSPLLPSSSLSLSQRQGQGREAEEAFATGGDPLQSELVEPRQRDSHPGGGRATGGSLAISGLPARSGGFCGFFFLLAVCERCFPGCERGLASGGGVWGPI